MRQIAVGFLIGAVVTIGATRVLSAVKATEVLSVGETTERVRPGNVISGANLGFRVERFEGRQVVGTLVVYMNGVWKESVPSQRVTPASP